MADFNFNTYVDEVNNAKIKTFRQYLCDIFYSGNTEVEFDNGIFETLPESDLLQSLNCYIKTGINAQSVANEYLGEIKKLFEHLRDYYSINNPIFVNMVRFNAYDKKAREITSKLKTTENKTFISDAEYEKLNNGIAEYMKNLDIPSIYDELKKKHDGVERFINAKEYFTFASIPPTFLAMKYGLTNSDISNLRIDNLDIANGSLSVNGFNLILDSEILNVLTEYLKIRDYILTLYSLSVDFLFIKNDGKPYMTKKGSPENAYLFKIMDRTIQHRGVESLAARPIVQMLKKGIDIKTISTLTSTSPQKLADLFSIYNQEESQNEILNDFFSEFLDKQSDNTPKGIGYIKCPFCGNLQRADSDNWLLAQLRENDKYFLACKGCEAKGGRIRY